jgi:hypothetical protein
MLLKRGYYVIIGGAALFAIGIAVVVAWALPVAEQIGKESAFLQGEQVSPGESRSLSLAVTDTSRPLSVAINSANADAQLQVILETPDGQQAINSTFSGNEALSADPTVEGTYELTMTNIGQSETSLNVIFGHLPGVGENDQVSFEAFSGVIAGVGTIIAGIIVMIAGVVIVIIDRRRRAPTA